MRRRLALYAEFWAIVALIVTATVAVVAGAIF